MQTAININERLYPFKTQSERMYMNTEHSMWL